MLLSDEFVFVFHFEAALCSSRREVNFHCTVLLVKSARLLSVRVPVRMRSAAQKKRSPRAVCATEEEREPRDCEKKKSATTSQNYVEHGPPLRCRFRFRLYSPAGTRSETSPALRACSCCERKCGERKGGSDSAATAACVVSCA